METEVTIGDENDPRRGVKVKRLTKKAEKSHKLTKNDKPSPEINCN